MNKYELGVIVRADLDEETFQAEMGKVKGLVERFEGTIDKVDEWGRRKLAYPIQKLTEGMYTFITFTAPADAPREIESRLRIMESVLRFLCIRKDEDDTATVAKPAEEAPVASKPVEAAPEVAEATTAEVVEAPVEAAETPEA